LAASVKGYGGLDYKTIGAMGKALAAPPDAFGSASEARA
jgi:hypothetical protein